MPSVTLNVPHGLGQEEAQHRLKTFFDRVRNRHQDKVSDLSESWQDNLLTYAFTTFGFKINGNVTVEPSEVKLSANIPFAAMMFKGKIEQTVREELTKVLG